MRSDIGITILPRLSKTIRIIAVSFFWAITCVEIRADEKAAKPASSTEAFERLKSLKGSWTDNSGTFGDKARSPSFTKSSVVAASSWSGYSRASLMRWSRCIILTASIL